MKKILLSLLTMVLMCIAAAPMWAIEQVDGVYQIGTADELEAFAQLTNNGEDGANAVLTADIDYTGKTEIIGVNTYNGTFDGAGHSVTIKLVYEVEGAALFSKVGGTVKNLTVKGEISTSQKYAGGVTARLTGGTITGCVVDVTINSTVSGDGTHGGITALVESSKGTITNNLIKGKFAGQSTNCWGGLVGWVSSSATIANNIMIADVSGTDASSSNTIARNPGNATITNNLSNVEFGSVPSGTAIVTNEQLASGEACYIANGRQSNDVFWYQTLGTDELPTVDSTHGVVYVIGRQHCNGDAYADGAAFSNSNEGVVKDEHIFENGVCTYCGCADENYMTATEDGYYELKTPSEWNWFAAMVNSGHGDLNGRQMEPIDFADVTQTPIGMPLHPYTGHFDGQLKPLTNINAMVFGTTNGAVITGIAIESGTAVGNGTYAAHNATMIGEAAPGSPTTLTCSYSKATIDSQRGGDTGGISGKFYGLMENILFAGGTMGNSTTGGLIGSSSESATPARLRNCVVASEPGALQGSAAICGWEHSNCEFTNLWVIEGSTDKLIDHVEGTNTNVEFVSPDEFATGSIAWKLNGNTFADAIWYQTIGEDVYPTLDPTHQLVYQTATGYASCGDDNFDDMRNELIGGALEYAQNVVAYAGDIEAYTNALNAMSSITDLNEFSEAWKEAAALRSAVENSEAAYGKYITTAQNLLTEVVDGGVAGPAMEFLQDYLESEIDPGEDYPNGSCHYIINNMQLTSTEIIDEIAYMENLYQEALKSGYKKDDEITNLLVNANLSDGFNGWTTQYSGSTFTTGGVKEVMPTAEAWNATFDMHQTLEKLADGVYEIQANASIRPSGNIYNTNYAGWLYANDVETYVMSESEDVISTEEAQDLVNCYITEGANHTDIEYDDGIISGYVPYGPLSCSYAFSAGRYLNRIVVNVTDGQLTVGLKMPGTGGVDWMGFGNFRLFYRGSVEEATDAIDQALAGDIARANTLLTYMATTDEEYRYYPNFSNELREQLKTTSNAVSTASSNDEKLELLDRFTEIFQNIYTCKKAYIDYVSMAELVKSLAYTDVNVDTDVLLEIDNVVTNVIWLKYEQGAYTEEEARAMEDLKATQYYKNVFGEAPELVNGYYQLSNAEELLWFAKVVDSGVSSINGIVTAPIDLAGIQWQPIGSVEKPFKGKFDGGLMPITNIDGALFGTISGASLTQIYLASGSSHYDATYAAHTASIVGHANPDSPSSLTKSISAVNIISSSGDLGGLAGKFYGTVENCAFVGTLKNGPYTTGGLVGSSSESATPLTLRNCFVFSDMIQGGDCQSNFVGWMHSNGTAENLYYISNIDVTFGHCDVATTNVAKKSREEFASGEVAYLLNGGNTDNPVWFQTIGEDPYPVFDGTHMIVIVNADGTYGNIPGTGVKNINTSDLPVLVNVYEMSGRILRKGVSRDGALRNLPKGIYVVGGKKVLK